MHKTKNRSLKERLIKSIENISVDIFGYEKKIKESVSKYLNDLSEQTKIPLPALNVQISKFGKELEVGAYNKFALKKKLDPEELIEIFTGEDLKYLGIKEKVLKRVKELLLKCSIENKIKPHYLVISITKTKKTIHVSIYDHRKFIKTIPIKELIKFFS